MKRATPLLLLLAGCGTTNIKGMLVTAPEMGGVVRVSTYRTWAHACPIGPQLALTSGHVIDPNPSDPDVKLLAGRWSDSWAGRGMFVPRGSSGRRDLALIRPDGDATFAKWFPIAAKAPFAGQWLYVLGFAKRHAREAFGQRVVPAQYLREEGGRIVLSANPGRGSSGSCVLTAAGEVVGIMESGWDMDNGETVAAAVAVWGESFEDQEDIP